jgi:hypothetical protein
MADTHHQECDHDGSHYVVDGQAQLLRVGQVDGQRQLGKYGHKKEGSHIRDLHVMDAIRAAWGGDIDKGSIDK